MPLLSLSPDNCYFRVVDGTPFLILRRYSRVKDQRLAQRSLSFRKVGKSIGITQMDTFRCSSVQMVIPKCNIAAPSLYFWKQ